MAETSSWLTNDLPLGAALAIITIAFFHYFRSKQKSHGKRNEIQKEIEKY
jgi:hypothetical protein